MLAPSYVDRPPSDVEPWTSRFWVWRRRRNWRVVQLLLALGGLLKQFPLQLGDPLRCPASDLLFHARHEAAGIRGVMVFGARCG